MAKVGFLSLGCPKNLVDSEVMLGLLTGAGHQITPAQDEAEIIIVNTCGFIGSAQQESVDAILEMARQKRDGRCRKLIVAGCLVERFREEICRRIPEVDAVIGVNEIPRVLAACQEERSPQSEPFPCPPFLYGDTDPRLLTTPGYSAYVKIAEGCDHPCTFCVIPQMRGRFRSRPSDSVIRESRRLAVAGVKELNLVGQDTTMYGWDHGDRAGLAGLIRSLGEIDGLEWIRFLYAYPNHIDDRLLEALAETEKACPYLDVPLQHVAGGVLKSMKRGGNRRTLTRLIQRIRRRVPGVAVRTTMIVGFPGETDEDFCQLLEFVKETEFDRLGVFCYSDEKEAASFALPGKVEPEVAKARRHQLMELQAGISRRCNQRLVGREVPVLLEGPSSQSDLLWEGRLSTQAPGIDGVVYLRDGIGAETRPGMILPVLIQQAHEYDLVGEVVT